jgi:plasmid stability protein
MPKLATPPIEDVASIARRVLTGCEREQANLQKEVDRARKFTRGMRHLDAFETERMEVLMGALESLECARPDQVEAAIYLLRHLANNSANNPLQRPNRRPQS